MMSITDTAFCFSQTPQPSPLAVSAVFFTAAENLPKNNSAGRKSAEYLQIAICRYDFGGFSAICSYPAVAN